MNCGQAVLILVVRVLNFDHREVRCDLLDDFVLFINSLFESLLIKAIIDILAKDVPGIFKVLSSRHLETFLVIFPDVFFLNRVPNDIIFKLIFILLAEASLL